MRFGSRLAARIAFGNGRKPGGLLYEVQIPPVGGDCLRQGFAGSALHPQGTSSLDPDKHKNPISIFWEGGRVNHGSAVQPPVGGDCLAARFRGLRPAPARDDVP